MSQVGDAMDTDPASLTEPWAATAAATGTTATLGGEGGDGDDASEGNKENSTAKATDATDESAGAVGDGLGGSNGDGCLVHKSALRDNIERKGKNAYYYAHTHRANGPQWDGKPEPRLLSRTNSNNVDGVGSGAGSGADDTPFSSRSAVSSSSSSSFPRQRSTLAFHYHKSTITNYAFSDEGSKIRLYVSLPGVQAKCPNEGDVSLDFDEMSFCLLVRNYPGDGEERCLSFGRLHGPIVDATFRKKKDRIVVTLLKKGKDKKSGSGTKSEAMVEGAAMATTTTTDVTTDSTAEGGQGETESGADVDVEEVEEDWEEWPGVAAKGDPDREVV